MGKIERISVSVADRERLERLVRDRNTPQKVVWRGRGGRLGQAGVVGGGGVGGGGMGAGGGKDLAPGAPRAPPLWGKGRGGSAKGPAPPLPRQAVAARDNQA